MSWSQIGGLEVGSAVAFMRQCANEFLATDAARAALIYPTRGGEVSVFACSESDHLVAFFSIHFLTKIQNVFIVCLESLTELSKACGAATWVGRSRASPVTCF